MKKDEDSLMFMAPSLNKFFYVLKVKWSLVWQNLTATEKCVGRKFNKICYVLELGFSGKKLKSKIKPNFIVKYQGNWVESANE